MTPVSRESPDALQNGLPAQKKARRAVFAGVAATFALALPIMAEPASPVASIASPLVIEDEPPPENLPTATGASVAQEIPIVAPPALDLFDPANPDPTYIPPNRRFGPPGAGDDSSSPSTEMGSATALPARLDKAEFGLPAGERPTKTASATTPADRSAWPMLSPSLIRGADFAAAQQAAAEEAPSTTLEGKLIPEDQPLGRRAVFRRWAIQTAKGERFPLTSNIPLMLAVKQKGALEGKVVVTGRWTQAKGEKRLKFFTPDTVRSIETPTGASTLPSPARPGAQGTTALLPGNNPSETGAPPSPQAFLAQPLGQSTSSEAVIIPPPKR